MTGRNLALENQQLRRQLAKNHRDFKRYQAVGKQILDVRRRWGNDLLSKLNAAFALMTEAVENCETCKGEHVIKSRCARCQTFIKFVENHQPKEKPNEPKEGGGR